jgi:nitrogen regulatory protein PII
MHFKLIIALVEDKKTVNVLDAAREEGATGATVVSQARGEGVKKALRFRLMWKMPLVSHIKLKN